MDENMKPWTLHTEPTRLHVFGVPIALLCGWVMTKLGFITMLFWYFISIPIHELGHATAAWMGSQFALPIGVFIPMAAITFWSVERSIFFGCLILGGILLLIRFGYRARNKTLLFLSIGILALWLHFTFILKIEELARIRTWAGVGGEFYLGTLLIILCFYELPDWFHWGFFRGFALFYGSYSYIASFSRWTAIRAKEAALPLGTFLSGGGDANGDMERLIAVHHWTEAQIAQSYFRLGVFCAILIAAHWAYSLSRRFRTSQR